MKDRIIESPFANTYGSLCLVEEASGKKFLLMQDCCRPYDRWGPLTEEQVAAFHLLCEIPITP